MRPQTQRKSRQNRFRATEVSRLTKHTDYMCIFRLVSLSAFFPEAVLTEYGHQIIRNFMTICEGRKVCQQQ